jgi:glutamine synthetase
MGPDDIKKKIMYDIVSKNIYRMNYKEIKQHGIKRLSTNLMESLDEFKHGAVLMDAIGRDGADLFIETKTQEWHWYMGKIPDQDYNTTSIANTLNVLFHSMKKPEMKYLDRKR